MNKELLALADKASQFFELGSDPAQTIIPIVDVNAFAVTEYVELLAEEAVSFAKEDPSKLEYCEGFATAVLMILTPLQAYIDVREIQDAVGIDESGRAV